MIYFKVMITGANGRTLYEGDSIDYQDEVVELAVEDLTEENVKKWVIEYAIEEVTDAIKRTQNP